MPKFLKHILWFPNPVQGKGYVPCLENSPTRSNHRSRKKYNTLYIIFAPNQIRHVKNRILLVLYGCYNWTRPSNLRRSILDSVPIYPEPEFPLQNNPWLLPYSPVCGFSKSSVYPNITLDVDRLEVGQKRYKRGLIGFPCSLWLVRLYTITQIKGSNSPCLVTRHQCYQTGPVTRDCLLYGQITLIKLLFYTQLFILTLNFILLICWLQLMYFLFLFSITQSDDAVDWRQFCSWDVKYTQI